MSFFLKHPVFYLIAVMNGKQSAVVIKIVLSSYLHNNVKMGVRYEMKTVFREKEIFPVLKKI